MDTVVDGTTVVDGANRRIILVGAGVVGRAIAAAHLRAGISLELVDTDARVLEAAVAQLREAGLHRPLAGDRGAAAAFAAGGLITPLRPAAGISLAGISAAENPGSAMPGAGTPAAPPVLVIESIVERREPKRELIAALDRQFGDAAVIATNTSSLRLADLESASERPERFCGLHFFMPVERRAMVEVVRGGRTDEATLAVAEAHVRRLQKHPLRVADSPGFVVNRILSPYLNQSMLLLGSGANPALIRQVAIEFGMPFSPLELVDLIGARTAFDAGRAFWQAFPGRIDPAPVLPGMIKAGLGGRASGCGFYRYDAGERGSPQDFAVLDPAAQAVVERYRRDERQWTAAEVCEQLTLPMLIEAACLLRDGVVASTDDVETAMRGGLDFASPPGFFARFENPGGAAIAARLRELGPRYKALAAPPEFLAALAMQPSVVAAVEAFASG